LIACNNKLEQENVTLSFSFRLDSDFNYQLFLKDIANLKKIHVNSVGIELVVNNHKQLPVIDTTHLHSILRVLFRNHLQVHLILTKWNDEAIHVKDSLQLHRWNLFYQNLLNNLLKDLSTFPINFIVLGVNFENIEKKYKLYETWSKQIKPKYKIPIFYSSHLDCTLTCPLHEYFDYVGVYYEPSPHDNHKKLARKLHPLISEKYKNKRIIITHANIQGNDAKLQLQNLLRFWTKKNLTQVNINSIYNQTVLSRDTGHFSLKSNNEFMNYLQEYIALK
jgi:hypothetical protein